MKPPKLPNPDQYLPADTNFITPGPHSHQGLSVPEVVFTYGEKKHFLNSALHIFPKLILSLVRAKKSYRSLRRNPNPAKKTVDPDFLHKLEKLAEKLGCSSIGYTAVLTDYIFKNTKILYPNAIVLIMNMDKNKIRQAPGIVAGKEIWKTYAGLGRAVNRLAAFMRKNGYRAEAGPAVGGETNYPLLAQKAGLGHIGKHGLLITRENGPSVRIASVYTDIENLPFTDNKEHQWISEFCTKCDRCVKTCPSGAIYPEPIILPNGSERHIDYTLCAVPFSQSMGCSICIKECPFFKSGYDKIKAALSFSRE